MHPKITLLMLHDAKLFAYRPDKRMPWRISLNGKVMYTTNTGWKINEFPVREPVYALCDWSDMESVHADEIPDHLIAEFIHGP